MPPFPLRTGVAIIVMQDFATKIAVPRYTYDDVHFGSAAEDGVAYAEVADLLQGDGLPIPNTRTRIADAYGPIDEALAKKNVIEL